MASRRPAGFQSIEERLRPFLRDLRRRCRLFQSWRGRTAYRRGVEPTPRAGGAGRTARLHDEPPRRAGGADRRRLRQVEGAVPDEPAFHRAALAVGGAGRIAAGSVSGQVMVRVDWVPTRLAATGTSPDAAYPSDGEDLGPIATGRAAPHPRKLYWRYKAGAQRAIRDGDWKYLRIAGNEFLFDVVKDPRERANLKDRQKDVFDRLKSSWEAWNDTMLPERATPAAY